MAFAKGRGVRVEIAKTYGATVNVSEVSEANPGVATAPGGALSDGAAGYFNLVQGMPRLVQQAVQLEGLTTTTAQLVDIDTTEYGNYTAGNFIPVTAWETISNATDFNKGGGGNSEQDVSVLLDEVAQNDVVMLTAETVSFSARMETLSNAAMAIVRAAARKGTYCVFRITLKDGSRRVFGGIPSMPTEGLASGQVGQQTFSVTLRGLWTEVPA